MTMADDAYDNYDDNGNNSYDYDTITPINTVCNMIQWGM